MEIRAEARSSAPCYLECVALSGTCVRGRSLYPFRNAEADQATHAWLKLIQNLEQQICRDVGLENTILESFRQELELYTSPLWYTMSFLCLFPNIKILVLQNIASWLGNHAGSESIYESFPGGCYLQNSEELYVTLEDMEDDDCTLSAVAPFLLLPRLKKLVFDQILGYEWHTRDPVPSDWPYDDKKSGLQELICSAAEVEKDQIGCLLRHLPILRTFV